MYFYFKHLPCWHLNGHRSPTCRNTSSNRSVGKLFLLRGTGFPEECLVRRDIRQECLATTFRTHERSETAQVAWSTGLGRRAEFKACRDTGQPNPFGGEYEGDASREMVSCCVKPVHGPSIRLRSARSVRRSSHASCQRNSIAPGSFFDSGRDDGARGGRLPARS